MTNGQRADRISLLQAGIIKYLGAFQFAPWNVLKRNIDSLYVTHFNEPPDERLEYKVLYPLLRAGMIETARRPQTGKLVYCLGPEMIIELEDNRAVEIIPAKNVCRITDRVNIKNHRNTTIARQHDSLTLLKRIPPLYTIITHWQMSETEVHFIYERFEKNHFKYARDKSLPNIYTSQDKIYSNRYIRIKNGMLYLIPETEDNIDGDNISLCYLEILKERFLFVFDEDKKELTCWDFHSILPFIVCRALILCDPLILTGGGLNNNEKITIGNVTNGHVNELKRIFGEISVYVEAKND
jgi:hypothetical protein